MAGFDGFFGNEKTVSTLRQMIAAGRLPHAVILEGEEGLGKRTLAGIIAKAAVCGEKNAPCGKCRACHLADVGSHPDITVLAPEGKQITVGAVRETVQSAYVLPSQGSRKVFIIQNTEAINEAGQNALLKTLEEPPEGVIFLLLCSSKSALLETVVSRCTVFSLSAPKIAEGVEAMVKTGIDPAAAEAALERTAGNIGRALNDIKGTADKVNAAEFLDLALEGKAYECLLLLKKLEKDRNGALLFFTKLHTLLLTERRLSALKGDSRREKYLRFMTQEVETAAENCRKNANLSLLFHNLCLKLG